MKDGYDDVMNENNVIGNNSINDLEVDLKMIIILPDLSQKRNPTKNTSSTVRHRKQIFNNMKDNDFKIYKSFANSDVDNDYADDDDSVHKSGYSEGLYIDIDNGWKNKRKKKNQKRKRKSTDLNKHTFIDNFRNTVNLVDDFKVKLSLDVIYNKLKEKRKFNIKEDKFLNLKLPKSRELKKLSLDDDVNEIHLEGENIKISNHKLLIFVFIVLVYFSFILVVINLDLYIYSI